MCPFSPSASHLMRLWHRASTSPRRTVVLCFAAVFAVTVVLAGRQYFLVRARDLDLRAHRLELQAMALDAGLHGGKRQMRFLRGSAERLYAEPSPRAPVPDPAVRNALAARANPFWSLRVPDADAPIRGIGAQELAAVPGMERSEAALIRDLDVARLMSQLLPVQHELVVELENAFFITTTGVVVAYPSQPDDRVADLFQAFAHSRLLRLAREQPGEHDVTFDPIHSRKRPGGARLLLATPVVHGGVVRGAIVFDVPQHVFQDILRPPATSSGKQALLDERGTLIASDEPDFVVADGDWLKTLPRRWTGVSVPMLLRAGSGRERSGQDVLLFRKLDNADLVLVDYVPAGTLFLAVASQFGVPFIGVWLLLGILLWSTLLVVDQLLARQMRLSDSLRELARVDALTGLANRRGLTVDFDGLTQRRHIDRPIALLMIDIDHFKRVNDSWGHAAGDEVLKHLATEIRAIVRPHDIVARVGGEEFCVLLPDTTAETAAHVAERLRVAIAAAVCMPDRALLPAKAPGREIRYTVSIGVAELVMDGCQNLEALAAAADQRLYAAKEQGRNRVVAHV
ncbi:putative diguanylate cyclase DgcQ [Cupriavidus laharis]|uniref:diguanylate cyclase n=2 Tax=Cupriavidus laharis TaxID=151654 RepID=A0ABM8X9M1_9BURK|nr:putative diguanylate cyclase DgcQ [Cupriavidus laharis]